LENEKSGKVGRKAFFFEKKKQKTFIYFTKTVATDKNLMDKSFLVLFFKKERLSSACFVYQR